MGKTTKIEYCDSTVNPVVGCTGCELYHPTPSRNHCYAATLINRYTGCKGWPKKFTEPAYFLERLEKAIRWPDLTGTDRPDKPWLNGMPRIIFVNDLGDGFAPDADVAKWLEPYIADMEDSPHLYLLLTKWPERMRSYFQYKPVPENFWLGTSVLRKRDYPRVEQLLRIRDARRWLSVEPLLEDIDLGLRNWAHLEETRIYFLALGGESGNARPTHPDWFRAVRDDCVAAGVPLFFKQWGEWLHNSQEPDHKKVQGDTFKYHQWGADELDVSYRVSKEAAGRKLDGRLWNQMPKIKEVR